MSTPICSLRPPALPWLRLCQASEAPPGVSPRWPGHSHLRGAVPDRVPFPLRLASPCPANTSAPGGRLRLLGAPHRAGPRPVARPARGAHTVGCASEGPRLILTTALGKRQICPVFPSSWGRNACVHTCVHAHVIQSIECQKAVTRASPGPISSSPTCRLLAARALCLLRHPDFGDVLTCQPQSPGTCQ